MCGSCNKDCDWSRSTEVKCQVIFQLDLILKLMWNINMLFIWLHTLLTALLATLTLGHRWNMKQMWKSRSYEFKGQVLFCIALIIRAMLNKTWPLNSYDLDFHICLIRFKLGEINPGRAASKDHTKFVVFLQSKGHTYNFLAISPLIFSWYLFIYYKKNKKQYSTVAFFVCFVFCFLSVSFLFIYFIFFIWGANSV